MNKSIKKHYFLNISISKLYTVFFFLGVFFIPFNSFDGLLSIGEFKQETCFYFFIIGFILLLLDKKNLPSILPPIHYLYLIILFISWCLIATLINIEDVKNNYFKQTTGIIRFIKQFLVIFFSAFLFLIYYWNVIKQFTFQNFLLKLRSAFLITLSFCFIIGFLQILIIYFKIDFLKKIINLFEYLPFVKINFFSDSNRIATVSYEPPFLAIYLISIFGWMLSYFITSKKWWRVIPTILILLLTYFSGSRTGMIIILIQLILFIFILLIIPSFRKFLFFTFLSVIISIFFILFTDILSTHFKSIPDLSLTTNNVTPHIQEKNVENTEKNTNTHKKEIASVSKERLNSLDFINNFTSSISNKTRFGMQYSSLMVFKDHPLTGVGLGQQTYYARAYYPKWATENNYEFKEWYNNENIKSFPPGYNIYTRILAELGIIGLLIYISIILSCLYFSFKLIKESSFQYKILGITLLISFIGLGINWLQIDSFRIFLFWIYIAILISSVIQIKHNE